MLNLGILLYTINMVTARVTNFENEDFFELDESNQEQPDSFENSYSVCHTKECFRVASDFWETMNKSVSPCEDFYEYACGNWANNNPIPPTEMKWDTMDKMRREVQYKTRDFLEEEISTDDILPVNQVKKFYRSCMNIDGLETTGLKPLEAILVRNGGWPLIMESEEWYPEEFSWQQIDEFYSYITQSALYSFEVRKDERKIESFGDYRKENSTIVVLKNPELPPVVKMDNVIEFNRTKMYDDGSYAKFIKEIALAFIKERSSHVSEEQLDNDITEMIEFEKKLGAERKFSKYESTFGNIGLLEAIFVSGRKLNFTNGSQIHWNQTMSKLFAEVNIELNGNEEFLLEPKMIAYLEQLFDILQETNLRTIVNYIHWNFLSQMLPYTTSRMQELFYELKKHLTGIKTEKPRWQTCVENMIMKHAVSFHFIKKYFTEDMKEDAERIFLKIQKELIKQILRTDWYSENLKKIEIEKILSTETIIGYPNFYDNETALINFYRGLPIGHQYLDNILMFKKYRLRKHLRNLRNPVIDIEWFPTLVNAEYNHLYNELIIPAGMFQFPFYSASHPEMIHFGSLGYEMGHELSHGFDIKGLFSNDIENLIDWPEEDTEKLEDAAFCFISQYGEFYKLEDEASMSIDVQTLGEDMANSVGLNVAFEALKEIEEEKNEPRLPGFEDLTNEQAFFLSFAKVWCTSSTPEYKELLRKYDVQSVPNYRVITSLQNSEGFAQAYNCPKGSPMNPKKKCKIW